MELSVQELQAAPVFLISLGIGLLMGLERERKPDARAGLRTFGLTGLAGALSGLLTQASGSAWLIPAMVLGLVLTMVFSPHEKGDENDPATTTTVALLLCFGLGVLAWYGYPQLAVALALAATSLLYFKTELHGVINRLTPRDLRSFLQFAIVAFIVLPVLPDRDYGPYGALNPYRIWLMVVLISGLGLVSYAVLRVVGQEKGTPLLGILGGLVSSTATTLAFSRHMKSQPALQPVALFVILLANLVVLLRLAIIAVAVTPKILPALLPVLGLGAAAGLVLAWRSWRALGADQAPELEMKNPSEMRTALAFAAFYAAVLLAVAWLNDIAGTGGVYLAAALSGLTDVDAISLSTLNLFEHGGIEAAAVVRVIALAYVVNLAFKFSLVWSIAGRGQAVKLAPSFGAVLVGLVLGLALT
ncbi:magnesium transporter MgtC [Solimonas fluminis]|uniref:Magnesium transporter MgtC n=1 Tax=Solimonas fluminis TaxID=2086571 RepID=A0A2S5TD89_9GAMM|nr:MgtC/SapB family protein [Solimonas fluminis]PPE72969.1 magnesium transporter MgtC [Solimonas fluminis]